MVRRWCHPVLAFLERRTHACCCSGCPHGKVNNLPSCVSGLCQISALPLSVPTLSACPTLQFSCVLSLVQLGLKTSNLKGHSIAWTCSFPPTESLAALGLVSLKISHMAAQVLGSYREAQQKAATRLFALCVGFCPLLI